MGYGSDTICFLQKKERPYSLGTVPSLPIIQYYYPPIFRIRFMKK
jgi:hypothetical protein